MWNRIIITFYGSVLPHTRWCVSFNYIHAHSKSNITRFVLWYCLGDTKKPKRTLFVPEEVYLEILLRQINPCLLWIEHRSLCDWSFFTNTISSVKYKPKADSLQSIFMHYQLKCLRLKQLSYHQQLWLRWSAVLPILQIMYCVWCFPLDTSRPLIPRHHLSGEQQGQLPSMLLLMGKELGLLPNIPRLTILSCTSFLWQFVKEWPYMKNKPRNKLGFPPNYTYFLWMPNR